jgi:hypothetical protein
MNPASTIIPKLLADNDFTNQPINLLLGASATQPPSLGSPRHATPPI